MKREPHTIQIILNRYRGDDGHPCCIGDASTGDSCRYFGTRSFGCVEVCCFDNSNNVKLYRRGDLERGTLIPHKDCPVWSEE